MNIVDVLLTDTSLVDSIINDSWKPPAAPLVSALGLCDRRRIVGGNDTLDVTTEGRIWLVLSGAVDVFVVDGAGRYSFAVVKEGGLIDSLPANELGIRIVGIPSAGTEVVETTREALLTLASRPERPALEQAWRGWLALVAQWHPPGAPLPKAADGRAFVVTALQGALTCRLGELEQRAAERAAGQRLAEQDFIAGLDGVIDLVGVRTSSERGEDVETIGSAASRVVRALGLPKLEQRGLHASTAGLSDAVEEIAEDNRLQYRAVELTDNWWGADLGPLLATFGPKSAPCALIRSGGRYLLYAGGPPRTVDGPVAEEIGSIAYSFYLPFPSGPLTAWKILRFGLQGGRGDVTAIAATLLITGLFSLVTPLAIGWLMDPIVPDAELEQVVVIAGALFLLAIGMTATFLVESLATLRLEARADNRVQAAVWIRLLNLRVPFFRDYTAGDLANRADGVNAIRKLISQSFTTFASGAMLMIFSLGLMIYYEWRVTLLVAIVSALFGGLAYLVGRRVLHYNFQNLDLSGKLQGTVLQLLGSIAKLRVAGAEREAFLQWLQTYRLSVAFGLRQRILSNRLYVARASFGPLITVVVLIVLGAHSGDLFAFFRSSVEPHAYTPLMSIADFVSYTVALGQFVGAVMSLTRASLFVVMMQPYFHRVEPILQAPLEPTGEGGRIPSLKGEIELRDVRFRYSRDAPLVLQGLSMRFPAGKFVAIVGPSGAGKSSMVRLLLGFDTPESGDIYVDGTDIRLLDLQNLRRQYGVVLQNGRMLAGSIYDNVSAGLPITPEAAMEALRIAALDEVVEALPMGLHTNMADGGASFSGGQRQRLLIARAVIRRPRVLIMDEATSALDNVTQRRVVENLRALECTQVVIAQRLSTVISADLIYVIDDGRVVESGSYLELLEKGAIFKRLAERQLL
jgi:NHLM bacteriocin system ABC transporter ATP-binding protein